jgi:hypothetical protein
LMYLRYIVSILELILPKEKWRPAEYGVWGFTCSSWVMSRSYPSGFVWCSRSRGHDEIVSSSTNISCLNLICAWAL